jgi:replication initiation protein RepC
MSYTQTAFTGRTGARPISALTRLIEREVATRLENAHDIDRNELYRVLDGAKTALGLSASALETLKHLIGYTRPDDYKGASRPIAPWRNSPASPRAQSRRGCASCGSLP